MNLSRLLKHAGKFLTDNSPTIMTAIGATGTLATAYFTGKASYEASKVIENERSARLIKKTDEEGKPLPPLEPRDIIELTWKLYIPAVGTAAATICCIVAANRVGARRAAALASAYTLLEKAFDEYKEKVIEKIGATKEQKIHDEIAQDHISKYPPDKQIIIVGAGDVLFREGLTGRYFMSTVQKIKAAQNQINADVINDGYASLSDLYFLLKLPKTDMSDEFGWNTDKLMEINFSPAASEDEKPCFEISFNKTPIREYSRYS
jgi:hypothetical protein